MRNDMIADLWSEGIWLIVRHALRYVIVLAVIAGAASWYQRRSRSTHGDVSDRPPHLFVGAPVVIWVRYFVLGLLLGGTWVLNDAQAPWLHALRVAVLLLIIGPAIRMIRRRWGTHKDRTLPGGRVVREWMVAKLALVVIAIGLELLLSCWMSRSVAAELVGLWLGVTVAIGGPLLLERLVTRRRLLRMATVGDGDDTGSSIS